MVGNRNETLSLDTGRGLGVLLRTVFNSISTTMVQPEVSSNLIATAETSLGRKEVDDELLQQRSCSSAFARIT